MFVSNLTRRHKEMKVFALTGFLCLSTLAMAQNITFDYARSANFSSYKTYQWVDTSADGATDQLVDQNIKRAIDAQLALKSMQRVETGGDLQVNYQVALNKEKQFDGWGSGPRVWGNTRVTTSTIEIGKLMVTMFDPAKAQLVWRGTAEQTIDMKKDPDKNFKTLEKTMAKLFKNYPPAAGK